MSERLYTSQTPETDSNDPATKHTYGMRLTFSADGTVSAGRVWCPNPKPPTYFGWALWRVSDQALLSSVDLTAVSLTAGAWNPVTIGSSVSVVSTEQYVVGAHYEGGHQVFSTTTVPFPLSNGAHITADTGMFINNGTPSAYPSSTFALYAFADVEFDATVAGGAAPAPVVASGRPAAPAARSSVWLAPLAAALTTPAPAPVIAGARPVPALSRALVWTPPLVDLSQPGPVVIASRPAAVAVGRSVVVLAPPGPLDAGTPGPVVVLAQQRPAGAVARAAVLGVPHSGSTSRVDCTVHRPFTGTATRGATGTVVRPNTGIVVRPHC